MRAVRSDLRVRRAFMRTEPSGWVPVRHRNKFHAARSTPAGNAGLCGMRVKGNFLGVLGLA